jgi:phage repressor protein C with HTH and peptisase S24 domain
MPESGLLTTHEGRYAILEADLPSSGLIPLGVLLQDPEADSLYIRLRPDVWEFAGEDAEVLELLQEDLMAKAAEMGAEALFAWLEDTLSGSLRITNRETVLVRDFDRTLNRLYSQHVRTSRASIPRYTLQVAAGRFLDNAEVEPDGFEEPPADLHRITPDLFAAEIVGTSMEPHIPDGSVCLFRKFGAGSRQGKWVLVEELGRGSNDRYTVKRYVSSKRPNGEAWEHDSIRLEPLNPEHEAWELNPEEDRYRIIAEFVRVLY